MRAESAVQMSILAVTGFCLMSSCDAGTSATIKLCGRKLTLFMSQICHAYNSPAWDDDPSVIDHAQARRKRELGIADMCCTIGCTWNEISEYCLISPKYENSPPFDVLGSHTIEDRSAEKTSVETPADTDGDKRSDERRSARRSVAREVGRARRRYGRGRCWCRNRRSGRRHDSLLGNMDSIKNVARAAPVVGTVSPLLTWAKTLYTDLPSTDKDRYAYVVYAQP